MRVLVTGASGCIGTWVVKQFLERGTDVLMLDVEPSTQRLELVMKDIPHSRLRSVAGRIEDRELIGRVVRDEEITHVVHLAAVLMPFCQKDPYEGAVINVLGTLNVFQAARDCGRPVRIVYASSSAVWGPSESYGDRTVTEQDPLKPATHYGVFKQTNENSARVFYDSDGISSIGLRPWTVYGVGRDHGLTADPTLAMRAAAARTPFRIRMSGNMDLQYVQDVAETFIRCLLSPLSGAHVFDLQGEIVEMQQLIQVIERCRPELSGLITASGPPVPVTYRMDDGPLREQVGQMPKTPLETGIQETILRFERLLAKGLISA